MTPPTVAELAQRLRARLSRPSRYCPHAPHPKQAEFLSLTTREGLYGGAAGGGKSDALLMAALQYAHVPGYSALILRRTYADLSLPGAIMDRARSWLAGSDAEWHDRDKRFTFPSGATLQFGYCDTEADRYRYQGAEFSFIAIDELTQWPEAWYRYLFSRLRRTSSVMVPLRMRAATNPGGIGHEWVRRRFVEPASEERPFVAALLDDNPSLDATEYREALAQLDTTTRRQLEHGVWIRDAEGLVYRFDEGRNVVPEPPRCDVHLLGLDFGVTDATAFVVLGWRKDDPTVYVLEASKRPGMAPSEAAERIRELEQRYRFTRIVGDVGGLGKAFAEEARRRYALPIDPAEKNNKRGYIALMNDALVAGRVKIVRDACTELATEWLELPWSDDREREAGGFDNHAADACLYAWRAANAFAEQPPAPGPAEGTAEYWEREERRMEREAARAFRSRW